MTASGQRPPTRLARLETATKLLAPVCCARFGFCSASCAPMSVVLKPRDSGWACLFAALKQCQTYRLLTCCFFLVVDIACCSSSFACHQTTVSGKEPLPDIGQQFPSRSVGRQVQSAQEATRKHRVAGSQDHNSQGQQQQQTRSEEGPNEVIAVRYQAHRFKVLAKPVLCLPDLHCCAVIPVRTKHLPPLPFFRCSGSCSSRLDLCTRARACDPACQRRAQHPCLT